jgi:hypothetical protein
MADANTSANTPANLDSINFTWNITNLSYAPQSNGQNNVVNAVWWTLKGVDANTNANSFIAGIAPIAYDANSTFTAYSDLTQNTVITWVTEAYGNTYVDDMKTKLGWRIFYKNANSAVTVATPPWVDPSNAYSGPWPPTNV